MGATEGEDAANLLDSEVIDAMAAYARKSAFQRAAAMIMVQCLSPAEIGRLEKMFVAIDKTHEVGNNHLPVNYFQGAMLEMFVCDSSYVDILVDRQGPSMPVWEAKGHVL